MKTIAMRAAVLALSASLFSPATARGQEIRVIASGAFEEALHELVPGFERAWKHKVALVYGPSTGTTDDAIPIRMQRGEPVDVVITSSSAVEGFIKQGKIVGGSQADLVASGIGVAVRKGLPRPDVASVEALKRTLLQAQSIAYSDSLSGAYVSTELFSRLGIADQVAKKTRRIIRERVGVALARGDAEIGFQQVSELISVPGIDYLGPLPKELQRTTVYAIGMATGARQQGAAQAFIRFLRSDAAGSIFTKHGLDPVRAPTGDAAKLVGEWRLVEMEQDGADDPSRGSRPIGVIYYSPNGRMAAQIMPDRRRASWPNTRLPTAEQALDAVTGYAGYFGTYTVDERTKTVTHHREGALNFDVVDFVRRYDFDGDDRLILFPAERTNRRLVWERIK